MTNHHSRNWRNRWTVEPVSRTAVHVSGLTVRVEPSKEHPENDKITLENIGVVDLDRWDLGRLSTEATRLWMAGKI